jgi:hypothetical protein
MWLSRKSSPEKNKGFGLFRLLFCAVSIFLLVCCQVQPSAESGDIPQKQVSKEKTVLALMPSAGEAQGWEPDGGTNSFSGESLFDHINGGADIYLEYGFATLVLQQYKKAEKAVSLEIYRMDDPAAAYGIFSYSNDATLSPVEVGSDGTIHPNGLFFWQDRYYVDMRQLGTTPILPDEFLALAKTVESKIGTTAQKPAVMNLLPIENMVPRSDVFASGPLGIDNQVYVANEDLFGLAEGEFAAIARYRVGQPEFSLVIAEYTDLDACAKAFLRFRNHFLGEESTRENQFVIKTMPGKYHGILSTGAKLVLVANADSKENALAMLDRASGRQKSPTQIETGKPIE